MDDIVKINSEESYLEYLNYFAEHDATGVALFTAPSWCAPCQRFEPHYKRAAAESDAIFLVIDIDDNEWALGYDVYSVPTCFLIRGNAKSKLDVPMSAIKLLDEIGE